MKKALFHTFIAYVVLNIFLVYTDKEEYDEAYHAGIAEVVDFRNSKILKIQIFTLNSTIWRRVSENMDIS